jgi:YVTN family beta-propeller protein
VRGRSIVVTAGLAALAMTAGGAALASASARPGGGAARSTAAVSPRPDTAAVIDGLGVIGTGSVVPLYTGGGVGTTAVSLPAGSDLIDAAFAPDGNVAYVVNPADGSVTPVVINQRLAAGLAVGTKVSVGNDPVAAAVTPNSKTVLVIDNHGQDVRGHYDYWVKWIKVNPGTGAGTVVARAKVGISPIGLAITPDGKGAYITNVNSGTVSAVSVARHKVVRTIHTGGYDPEAIAITPDGKYAYVANNGSGTVTPIRISGNAALAPIKVGKFPADIAITPDGKYAYVTNNGSGTVSKIKLSDRKVVKTIRTGGYPDTIAITPNGKDAYVGSFDDQAIKTHLHTVTAISLTSGTVARQISVGRGPISLAVQPDGQYVMVAGFYANTITPITVATNTAAPATSTSPWNEPGYIVMRP